MMLNFSTGIILMLSGLFVMCVGFAVLVSK